MQLRLAAPILLAALALAGQGRDVLPADRLFFREYGDAQGLHNTGVTALTEDAHGFLYVGTNTGLYRFNGARFESIPMEGELHTRWVVSMAPHPTDGIWIGTPAGLAFVLGGEVRWATLEGEGDRTYAGVVCVDLRGRAWTMGNRGLFRQGRDEKFTLDPYSARWGRQRLAQGAGPVVAVGSRTVCRLSSHGRWEQRTTEGIDLETVQVLVADHTGTLWAGRERQVWRLPPRALAWEALPTPLPEPIFGDATPTPLPRGGIALFTMRSLVLLQGDSFQVLDRNRGLPEEELLAFCQDRQGNQWMGGSGLFRKLGTGRFQVFNEQAGLPDRRTWGIHRRRDGRLFVATHRGVAVLDRGRFHPIPGLVGTYIQRMVEDDKGDLWCMAGYWGLFRIPAGTLKASRIRTGRDPIVTIMPRSTGGADVLYANAGPVFCPDPGRLPSQPVGSRPTLAGDGYFRMARRDSQGRLVVTSTDGLHVLESGQWRSFRSKDGLLNDNLQGLRIGPDGTLWITYLDPRGITRARLEGDRLVILGHCREGDALPSDSVFDTLPRSDGGAWLLTNRGLVSWFPDHYRLFTTQDGIGSNDCNEGAIWQDPDSVLWFGTTRGLVRGTGLGESAPWPSVRLTGQITPLGVVRFPHEPPILELPYRQREVTFTFAPRRMTDEGTVRYQVCLSGHDQGWYDSPDPVAHYAGLREGFYTFLVRGRRPGEPWGPTASLDFRILPPWYRSWWGWALWLCTGAGVLWSLSQLRLRALTRQRNLLNQEVQLRTREIQVAREALEVANEALQAQTITDPLTHLKNRRFLDLTLPIDLARAALPRPSGSERRQDRAPEDLIFLLVDLDRFKVINDTHGHRTGDDVLQQAAGVLKQAMRETDALVRWGGEEFLLLARKADRREGGQIAERIRAMVSTHPFEVGLRSPLHVTCSVGFAPYPLEGLEGVLSWERVVDLADQCLYLVKRSGRNGWLGVLDGQVSTIHAGNLLELHAAAERGEVELLTSLEQVLW